MNSINVTIGGIKVKFPSKPYPSQISMMDKIIKGLQKKQNCLLESPTGSGKTLALLCSALGWQFNEKNSNNQTESSNSISSILPCFCNCNAKLNAKLNDIIEKIKKKPGIKYEDDNDDVNEKTNDATDSINRCPCSCHGMYIESKIKNNDEKKKIPTIYFGTRTHKQIANVIKELRKTAYANEIKMTILSSRQHTCIHPKISKSAKKNELCKELLKGNNNNNNNNINSNKSYNNEIGMENGCIYLNKWKKIPISYEAVGFEKYTWDIEDLVKSSKRKKICPYYAARDLAQIVDVIFCPYNYLIDPRIRSTMGINLQDQIVILDEAHNIEDACRESTSFLITKTQLEIAKNDIDQAVKFAQPEEIIDSVSYFATVFEKLSGWISRNSLNMEHNDFLGSMSKIWNGIEIVAEFKLLGIGADNFNNIKQKANKLFSEENSENVTDSVKILVEHIILILDFLYSDEYEFMEDYRVAITKTKVEELPRDEFDLNSGATQKSQYNNEWTFALHFWCLNPCVAFKYLKTCHSVILCSGTLSPMETFQSELGCKFDHQLEANHVISDKQVWVGSLGYGPTDTNLQATFKNCETYAFQDEIGRLVLDICKNVPYGVLCFLPSYTLLNKLMNRWNETNMIDILQKHKTVFSESRVAKDFNDLLADFYNTIENSNIDDQRNGALLLAVYRGRASEGLDFSDNYARAVIAVGIPYPNVKDVQVDLKRKYNNALCNKKKLLNGDEWYEIQAYRAVNQALGRCIRHRNDWGAIILVDDRYFRQPQKYSKGLSKWIRKQYNTYRNYNDALKSLKEFVNSMKNFKKQVDIEVEPIQSTIEPTIPNATNTSINSSSDKSVIIEESDSSLSINLTDDKDINDQQSILTNATNTILPTQESQQLTITQDLTFNDSNKFSSPNTQRKRQRDDATLKNSKLNQLNKKSNLTSIIEFTNFNSNLENKKSSTRSEYFSITSDEDDFDNDFKQAKNNQSFKTKNQNQSYSISVDEEFKKQKSSTLKFQPSITSTIAKITQNPSNSITKKIIPFNCIHCNNFICDLNEANNRKINLNNLQMSTFIIDEFITKFNCKNVTQLNNSIDITAFKSNTNIRKSGTSDQFINNSYIDENETNCWQFFECIFCFQVIGFILKFTNNSDFKDYLNKILLICQ